jgi:hypothetical protein
MKHKVLSASILVLATILALALFWTWNSGFLSLFLSKKQHVTTSCFSSGDQCATLISVRDRLGVDYTTSVYLFWGDNVTSVLNLPADYVLFDPEASVEIKWATDGELQVEYEGGDYITMGDIPQTYRVSFLKKG